MVYDDEGKSPLVVIIGIYSWLIGNWDDDDDYDAACIDTVPNTIYHGSTLAIHNFKSDLNWHCH